MAEITAYAGAVWWCLAITLFCATLLGGLAQPFLARRRASRADQPPVSVILPIKMLNGGFGAAQASAFEQDYPGYEILIGAEEANSPALEAMRSIAAAHPEVRSRFLRSDGKMAVSPKLNNLATPLAAVRNDLILAKDSNITFCRGTLAAFVRSMVEGTGLAVAVPVAVRPVNFPGRIEACLLNGHARLLLAASSLGLGFGVGKTMLFRKSDLARAGGIAAISHLLAEDTALSRALAGHGLKTVFSDCTVAQEIGAPAFAEIYSRQLRWSVIRRQNETYTFPLEPLASPLPAALAGALAAPLASCSPWLAFALTLLAWFAAEMGFALCKRWEVSAWSPLAFLGREILALSSWLHAFATDEVVWAEARLNSRHGARAAQTDPPPVPEDG